VQSVHLPVSSTPLKWPMQHSTQRRGVCRAAVGALSLFWAALTSSAQALELNRSRSGRRLSVTYGTWGVYGGAPAEKRCDSTLFNGPFACCWKNSMTKEVAKRMRTRYRWVCNSDPPILASAPDCNQVEAPGNKSLHQEPHACRRHVHNYVEYRIQMTLYYVLYSSGVPIVLDDSIAPNCSVGIRNGTASLLQVSTQAVEILSGPTLTTAARQDGTWVQSLWVSLRFVPDYELDRLYLAAMAEGNYSASKRYNFTLKNIHESMTSKNALANLSALDEHLTRSLRDMGAALSHVNVDGLNVTTSRRNWLGDVIRESPAEVSRAHRACAVPSPSSVIGAFLAVVALRFNRHW